MPGDPLRAKFIADTFLQDAVLVNEVRGMLAYTGTYNGKPVTVMGSGMGMPSIGIYSYELFKEYDVDRIIRIGSAGTSNRSDGFGIDAQGALRLHRREILKACSLPEVYQYSSFKKDAKSCVIRQPSATSFQLRLT